MTYILAALHEDSGLEQRLLTAIPNALDRQASESTLDSFRVSSDWQQQKRSIQKLLTIAPLQALQALACLIDTLDQYAPPLKGLQAVHSFACEALESLTLGSKADYQVAAAFVYGGEALAMSPLTVEAAHMAVENLLLSNSSDLAMSCMLGVKQVNPAVFRAQLPILLRQIQLNAFSAYNLRTTQEALTQVMKVYVPGDSGDSKNILHSVHTLLAASLKLCESGKRSLGQQWISFLITHTPMLLRNDLRHEFPTTCDAGEIFRMLFRDSNSADSLCESLPILATFETSRFCNEGQVDEMIRYLLSLPPSSTAFKGLGRLASVILDRFSPYLEDVSRFALTVFEQDNSQHWRASQILLSQLLCALGPITLELMITYLHCPPVILLGDVRLLEMISTLLPNLSKKINQLLVDAVESAIHEGPESALEVLAASTIFPLEDPELAKSVRKLVNWSLEENKGSTVVLLALQLATNPHIATVDNTRELSYLTAQLLLADDPNIVHMALSTLANPSLAGVLDEDCCRSILMALHQSLEPSVQIVAAKLLTHLSTAHRAIVQPLAWAHIRQSLSLLDFLQSADPARAVVEACIISNLLPALPASIMPKYARPVRDLILSGLEQPHDSITLSLIFQGLANLARFETWQQSQQVQLALDLLEMTQEIPKDSKHAALNAISRLLTSPVPGGYEMLMAAHATFRSGEVKLDPDLKALISGIYGMLGSVERNPVISRDSRAAIDREHAVYDNRAVLISEVAEARDRSSASKHVNWLVAKALQASPMARTPEVLEAMTALSILQFDEVQQLLPDLPIMIMSEIRTSLEAKKPAVRVLVLLLAAVLHTSRPWLVQYWSEAVDLMSRCMISGDRGAVMRSIGIIMDAM